MSSSTCLSIEEFNSLALYYNDLDKFGELLDQLRKLKLRSFDDPYLMMMAMFPFRDDLPDFSRSKLANADKLQEMWSLMGYLLPQQQAIDREFILNLFYVADKRYQQIGMVELRLQWLQHRANQCASQIK